MGAPVPVLLYQHGYRGPAAAAMRSPALAERLGAVLVAVQFDGDDWQIANMPGHSRVPSSDARVHADALLADLAGRHPDAPRRIVATGFSGEA
ncbi:hypothetical protein LNKW23_24230 [Paralimibaculum aggregatum]|uniref:Esterase n=1 Tax=Paralimibaculum aggregatum TaxID=3036245 RepID=A0ABQ6LLP2_9RHOB|nr:hypothetical protein [Limibaculum sp. NKW23]GMG83210.1 hypothetical protein LNKW23_24230 [Limibaculum sp. NKW23]